MASVVRACPQSDLGEVGQEKTSGNAISALAGEPPISDSGNRAIFPPISPICLEYSPLGVLCQVVSIRHWAFSVKHYVSEIWQAQFL